ncbi:MAG: sulfurtransferase-like selenium metabolism protein YedF [Planctomycetota bacterium]|jgi:hypothetical protein
MKTVIVISRDQMGAGDADLGARILKTFLQKTGVLQGLEALLFYNAGVKLVGPDSPVRGELMLLEENGVDLVPCGTCLEHYGVVPAVGKVGSMDEILGEIERAEKVLTL